jgi:hypothetical protein
MPATPAVAFSATPDELTGTTGTNGLCISDSATNTLPLDGFASADSSLSATFLSATAGAGFASIGSAGRNGGTTGDEDADAGLSGFSGGTATAGRIDSLVRTGLTMSHTTG